MKQGNHFLHNLKTQIKSLSKVWLFLNNEKGIQKIKELLCVIQWYHWKVTSIPVSLTLGIYLTL